MADDLKHLETIQCLECLEIIPALAEKCKFCGTIQEAGLKSGKDRRFSKLTQFQRNQAEALKREAAAVPLTLRRQLKIFEYFRNHPKILVAANALVAALVGIAAMEQVGPLDQLLLGIHWRGIKFLYKHWIWVTTFAGFLGFYGMFLLTSLWLEKPLEVVEEYLLDKKAGYLKQAETIERLKRVQSEKAHAHAQHDIHHHVAPKPHEIKHLHEL